LGRVLTAFPDHPGARALQAQLETQLEGAKPSAPATEPEAAQRPQGGQDPEAQEPAPFAFDGAPSPHADPQGPQTDSSRPLPAQGADHGAAEADEPVFLLDLDASEGSHGAVSLDELISEEVPDGANMPRSATRLDKHFDTFLMHAGGGEPIAPLTQVVEATDYDTQFNLGIAYKEMGLFADALKQFDKLVEVAAYRVSARSMIALCQEEMGQRQAAQQTLQEALALPQTTEQERAALHYDLAVSLLGGGDEAAARQHFEQAADALPDFRDVAARLAHPHLTGPG
jgi:hypothetical protein